MFLSAIIASLDQEERVNIKDNSVLILNLNKPLADREMDDPLSSWSLKGDNLNRLGVIDIKQALEHAKTDEKIK